MRLPVIETQPAELKVTALVLASHVVAALVLLDRHPALRARFCVYTHPFRVLALLGILALPTRCQLTVDGVVVLQPASEAEDGETFTFNGSGCETRILHAVDAVRGRAPPDRSILFYVRIAELLGVSGLVVLPEIPPVE